MPEGRDCATELDTFYKQFMHVMSVPVETNGVTGVTGRGTEEVKTNVVSGRVRKGRVGLCIDVGRPGAGARMYDVEKNRNGLRQCGRKAGGQGYDAACGAHCRISPPASWSRTCSITGFCR
jgi:hypothetical protein